jgi:hypothetical protein
MNAAAHAFEMLDLEPAAQVSFNRWLADHARHEEEITNAIIPEDKADVVLYVFGCRQCQSYWAWTNEDQWLAIHRDHPGRIVESSGGVRRYFCRECSEGFDA